MMALEKPHDVEQRLVLGLIVSLEFINLISPGWGKIEPLFLNDNFRTVGRLCLDFFAKYKEIPKDLDSLLTDAVRRDRIPKADAELIDKALRVISDRWDDDGHTFQPQHQFDRAVTYFRLRRMELRLPNLEGLLDGLDVEAATELVAQSLKPTIETDPASLIRGAAMDAAIAANAGDLPKARVAAWTAATVGAPTEKLPDPWEEPEPPPFQLDWLPTILRHYVEVRARVSGCQTSPLAWS
jgi:hypothetical protein